jgi:hypothetical protein
LNVAETIQETIEIYVSRLKPGTGVWINSHEIGDLVACDRMAAAGRLFTKEEIRQTLDYVQHVFRESFHSCRYASSEGSYFIHPERECTPACRNHQRRPERALCPSCFVLMTTQGTCSLGCDEETS